MRTFLSILCVSIIVAGCDIGKPMPLVSDASEKSPAVDKSTHPTDNKSSETKSDLLKGDNDQESFAEKKLQQRIKKLDQDIERLKQKVAVSSTNEEQARILQRQNPIPMFVDDMIEFSNQFHQTEAAVDAMLSAVARSSGERQFVAMNHLLDNFSDRLQLKKMADQFLKDIPSPKTESYLLKMIDEAPDSETKAHLLLGYSNYVDQIAPFRNALAANPALAAKLPGDQMDYINQERTEQQKSQREDFLQQIIDEHQDVVYRGRKTYADVATAELYELQYLSVGKTAPELTGKDMDGAEFNLSDYRGKIVMLDFWGHWCPPCRAMYGHEQQLVEKLGKAPFALLGVNSDPKIKTAISAIQNENLAWRNFWIGPQGTNGPIAKQWNISAWPTVYLIDAKGVIRHKDILGNDLNAALQEMLLEMGHDVDLAGIK